MVKKINEKSYCHDCGKVIEGENFYCEKCFEENGLNKFNFVAFILSMLQPLFAIILCLMYRKHLNPGIYKSCSYGLIGFITVLTSVFIIGFIVGILGLA